MTQVAAGLGVAGWPLSPAPGLASLALAWAELAAELSAGLAAGRAVLLWLAGWPLPPQAAVTTQAAAANPAESARHRVQPVLTPRL